MFKKVITYKSFWKSVVFLALPFMIIFFLINWGIRGFEIAFFDTIFRKILAFAVGGFIYGFAMTYAKFWAKLKEKENRNK